MYVVLGIYSHKQGSFSKPLEKNFLERIFEIVPVLNDCYVLLMYLDVDIESFWTEDYAGQIPNRGLWLEI